MSVNQLKPTWQTPSKEPDSIYKLFLEVDQKALASQSRRWFFLKPKQTTHKWSLHVGGNSFDLSFRVYVPSSQVAEEKIPPPYCETVLSIQDDPIRLGISPEHVLKRLKHLQRAKIIYLEEIRNACVQKTFDQFIQNIERPWRWKTHLSQFLSSCQTYNVLNFIHRNLPLWQERVEEERRIFIISTERKVRFSFEYDSKGTIWLHHSNWDLEKVLPLATDLDQGNTFQVVEFDEETGSRIRRHFPFFNDQTVGLIYFKDFSSVICETKEGPVLKTFAKHELADITLAEVHIPAQLKGRVKMAQDLLKGLLALQAANIVHTAVFPSNIHICYEETGIKAALGGIAATYLISALPKRIRANSLKWKEWIPPECEETTDKITNLFAIPVYQLGMCLKSLFDPASFHGQIVAKMIDPDPQKRPTLTQALNDFEEDFKETEPLAPQEDALLLTAAPSPAPQDLKDVATGTERSEKP